MMIVDAARTCYRDRVQEAERVRAAARTALVRAEEAVALARDPSRWPVDTTYFSLHAYHCLFRAGLSTLGQVTERSAPELLLVRSLGVTTLFEIRETLRGLGLALRDDPSPPPTKGSADDHHARAARFRGHGPGRPTGLRVQGRPEGA